MAAAAPRRATADALRGKKTSGDRAMFAHRLCRVGRACRREAAPAERPAQKRQHRGDQNFVGAEDQQQQLNDE